MWFPWNELLMCMSKRLIWSIPRPPMELKEGDISHQRNLRRMEKLRCQMLLKKGQWGGSWPWWWPQHQPFYCSAYNQDLCSYTDQDFFHINRGVMSTVMFLVKIAFILKTCLYVECLKETEHLMWLLKERIEENCCRKLHWSSKSLYFCCKVLPVVFALI